MTIGTSNTTGYARSFGTFLGAACAVAAWYATSGNVYGLAVLGLLMATWTSYLNIVKKQGPMSRYIMLTYNLSVLYAYSLMQKEALDDDDEGGDNPVITDIVLHRVVAVLSGCAWGVIITRVIWPVSARAKLKHNLSLLWLRMSLIWKRDPLSTMAMERRLEAYMSPREKLEIERFQSHLESLQAAARSEFELRSAFADAAYGNILRRTRSMMDAFHAMNLELVKSWDVSEGEISILRYTAQERKHLSSRISHLLSVMASSMKLEYPLVDVLPSIEHARDRLLARIFRYRQDHQVSRVSTDEDYALIYAYSKQSAYPLLFISVLVSNDCSSGDWPVVDGDRRGFRRNREAVRLAERRCRPIAVVIVFIKYIFKCSVRQCFMVFYSLLESKYPVVNGSQGGGHNRFWREETSTSFHHPPSNAVHRPAPISIAFPSTLSFFLWCRPFQARGRLEDPYYS